MAFFAAVADGSAYRRRGAASPVGDFTSRPSAATLFLPLPIEANGEREKKRVSPCSAFHDHHSIHNRVAAGIHDQRIDVEAQDARAGLHDEIADGACGLGNGRSIGGGITARAREHRPAAK